MRLDLFLKHSRLVPRRSVAQEMCDAGAVAVNGQPGKPGRDVKVGDTLVIRARGRQTTARVARVPARAPSKADAPSLSELIAVESYDTDTLYRER